MRRTVADAKKHRGATGDKLVELLERRLDNLVFRAGFAPTIPAARQLVSHGHFQLNGKRVTIPSIRLRVGDAFGPTAAGSKIDLVRATLEDPALERPEWIALDSATATARLSHLPGGDAAPFPLDLQRVVEYYATRM
ncbi:30S ribosomal protein S4 [bioreactor metagenome]|uniref:30S ribosomal protein S4 n=1 Tax=bioreactor metagenome TaxID=1076179 RepID=A0A645G8L1_9ZZZZ